jgi:hypothetical protein
LASLNKLNAVNECAFRDSNLRYDPRRSLDADAIPDRDNGANGQSTI